MKLIIIAIFAVLFGLQTICAQMHISTDLRQDAVFDEITKAYDVIGENTEELTFFDFNKEMTMFKHTTPSMTSAYIIKSTTENKEDERWEFDIVSDVGNSYYMILDMKNNNIRFVYVKNDNAYLVQHRIKKIWFDE